MEPRRLPALVLVSYLLIAVACGGLLMKGCEALEGLHCGVDLSTGEFRCSLQIEHDHTPQPIP